MTEGKQIRYIIALVGPWDLVGWALMGRPLRAALGLGWAISTYGPGSYGRPWGVMGLALMCRDLTGRTLMGRP